MRSNPVAKRTSRRLLAVSIAAALCTAGPRAEDIDIYGGVASDATVPNVLFFIDNTSNWSTAKQDWKKTAVLAAEDARAKAACTFGGVLDSECHTAAYAAAAQLVDLVFKGGATSLKQGQVELRTLSAVLKSTVCSTEPTVKLKAGLMLISDGGTVRSNGDAAGYIKRTVRRLDHTPGTGGVTSCATFLKDLDDIDTNIQSPSYKAPSNADYSAALYEAFKYFGGYTYPGASGAASPVGAMGYGPVRFSKPVATEDPDAFTDAAKTTYRGPAEASNCSRSFIVLVGNGYPNAEPNAGPARFQGLGYTPPMLTEDPSRFADEWTQFLNNTDTNSADAKQGISTFTINVAFDKPADEQITLLRSMALHGGGEYAEVRGSVSHLAEIFSSLMVRLASVDSVFTATTLPVSSTTQGTYLNQLFIGMFRPDGSGKPRWVGNLKQYKLGLESNGDVRVVDSKGNRALNTGTGFFNPEAVSYWTGKSVYFTNRKMGTPETASDSPDGQIVEKGGVAQRLREANLTAADGRRMYTLPLTASSGALLADTPFVSANLPDGYFTDDEISWIRGENNTTWNPAREYAGAMVNSAGATVNLGLTGARPSIHGDILHSRPVAVNYGSRVVVFYGANDGVLRAVDGDQTGTTAGQELWSFVAPEHYRMLFRQRNNEPALFLPSTDEDGETPWQPYGTAKKNYAFDGPIGLFARYSSTTRALIEGKIYAAMRRGGRAVYAFDVTNPTAPTFVWKVSNLTPGFERLGHTWSMPRPVIFPPAYSPDPVIIMGGGYDRGEDTNGSLDRGNRVYIINGRTGAKLGELPTDWSVPGDVTVSDTNGDKVFDRAYLADVRGNLYRINMTDASGALLPIASWTIKKIAALGGKVFYAPDVVVTKNYVAVLAGTGDREKPLMTSTGDRFFLVKDTLLGAAERTDPIAVRDLSQVARVDESRPNDVAFTDVDEHVSNSKGCYLTLSTQGEKVVNAPFTIAGVTYFGTNRPTPDATSCTGSRGQARSYQFPLFCGVPRGTVLDGGGMPPSPVGGLVAMTGKDGTQTLVPFVIGAGAERSPFEAERPRPPVSQSRKRNYWHINDGNR